MVKEQRLKRERWARGKKKKRNRRSKSVKKEVKG